MQTSRNKTANITKDYITLHHSDILAMCCNITSKGVVNCEVFFTLITVNNTSKRYSLRLGREDELHFFLKQHKMK